MRLVVHDYAGHPGQVHLSRELARRGHWVEHEFCASCVTGRGAVDRRDGDPDTFSIRALQLRREFARYSPSVRVRQEIEYARIAEREIGNFRPDVAVLSNVPLLSLFLLSLALRRRRIPYVFWQQDVCSDAVGVVARERLGPAGSVVGWIASYVERLAARGAASVTPISDTFIPRLDGWGVPRDKIHVVPNWGAIDEMPQRPKDNGWSRSHGLANVQVVMYAGTLGLKHDPSVLTRIARELPRGACVVVVSEGKGRQWLEAQAHSTPNLKLLDYQPYESLPEMLASADVLVVLLEGDASRYSVPSKVLNYLCAGRPVLGVLPADNAAAQMIGSSQGGLVVDPRDPTAASSAITQLLADDARREKMGAAGRQYAEAMFDVRVVADTFESVISAASRPSNSSRQQST